MTPKYINEKEVSRITGIGIQTLRNYRSLRKGLPFVKLDRAVRYNFDDVISYMESNKVEPK